MFISTAKLMIRFCYLTATMFLPLHGAPMWHIQTKFSKFWWNTSPNNVQMKISKEINLGNHVVFSNIYYPRFLTLCTEWLRFLVLITWAMKTSNIYLQTKCFSLSLWSHEQWKLAITNWQTKCFLLSANGRENWGRYDNSGH